MAGPFVEVDYEVFVEAEGTYGDIAATPSAGDALRTRTRFPFKRLKARNDRDKDSDNSSTAHTTQGGRESSEWELEMAATPSGVTGTPTAPDAGPLLKQHFGVEDVGAGHTTTTTGSTTTVVEGTSGATTALGAVATDFIVVDVSAAIGLEARPIVSIATDAFTVTPALSGAPANARNVYGTVTYRFNRTPTSLGIYSYLSGDNFREMLVGAIASDFELSYDASGEDGEVMLKFSGAGAKIQTFSTSKPTPTLAGVPLVQPVAYAWIGSTKHCITSLTLKSNNAQELRNNESCFNYPTGVKLTGNGGKRLITLDMSLLLTTGTVEGYFDNADALTAYDVVVQLGNTVGNGIAFRVPKFVPDTEVGTVDGEVSLNLSGRCYGNGTDNTELSLCFF